MPVAVYYGDESYLLEQAANRLRQSVVDPAFASLCHRVYDSPSVGMALEAVGSVSLALGGNTLIELKDCPFLVEAAKDKGSEAQLESLKELLESVEPTKTVFFLSSKLDGKIKFPKWLMKHPAFTVQKFESFKFWETDKVAGYILDYARVQNIPLTPEAADLLVSILGVDLRLLINEIDKLQLYTHGRPITEDDVRRLSNHADNLFQIINRWVLQEKPSENFKDLSEILLKRHPIEIFATFQSYFNNLFRVLWMSHQGHSMDAISQFTGQKPFTIKKHQATFRSVPKMRWLKLKRMIVDMEWRAKTGQMDGLLALETLLGS